MPKAQKFLANESGIHKRMFDDYILDVLGGSMLTSFSYWDATRFDGLRFCEKEVGGTHMAWRSVLENAKVWNA